METKIISAKYAVYLDGHIKAIFQLSDGKKLMKTFNDKETYSQFITEYNANRSSKISR